MTIIAGSLKDRDASVIADIGRLRFSPLSLIGGRGSRLTEEGGRQILDLSASGGAASLGYGHPAIVEAVEKSVRDAAGASLLLYPNEPAVALAERLLGTIPGSGQRRVWFGHSGSDANDCALRVVTAATERQRIISFIGSYHGNLTGSMGISGHTAMTHTLPRAGTLLLPYPDPFRPEFSANSVLELLDYQFRTTCPPEQVAAVFIEPLLSDGGLIVPPTGFLAQLQQRCRQHGILIVVDEVKVGLARTGLMHCFQHECLEPDLVVFGKGFGGGLPLSAVVGPASIMDHAPAFVLQTTAGNPISTAAGGAVLKVIEEDNLVERSQRMGKRLLDRVSDLAAKHAIIGDVRGRGLSIGIDLVKDRGTREAVPVTTTAKIIYRAYQLGAALYYVGLRANVLELVPPLILTESEVDEGVAIIGQSIEDVFAGKVSDADVLPFMMW
ncbi:aspartate aminotransferase family protein [Mesorhizobium sp. B4-1-4]|uniref:aspartate aminotransferase family protein n=1 Tax=Mesorhizobium sp. B4-1-4 TaxID=2589888 RepID=UPI0015E3D212|nr:aspartate aminotransferase family protein [Mesorhizobium sp. B4-1-4]UCI31854.1 aspartate aminotransferase family protein [Mesorhizobium sp. B4-1-4]